MKTKERLFNRNFVFLTLSGLIVSFGYSMIAPLITPYGVSLGTSLAVAGSLTGIYSLAALLVRPIGGVISDRFDKRMVCIISVSLITLAIFGYSIAKGVTGLFIVRVLHGIAFGVNGTVNIAILYDYIPKSRLAEGIGYYSLGQVVSQVCGPGIGVYIKDTFGYEFLFRLIAFMSIFAILLLLFTSKRPSLLKKDKTAGLSFSNLIAIPCIIYALVGGVFSLENGVINSFLLLLASERGIQNASLFFSVNAIVLFVIRMSVGKIADRHALSLIVNVSLITSILAMVLVGSGKVLAVLLVAAVLKAVGQGSGQISLQSACMKKVEPAKVGIASSTFYIGADLGQGLGPIFYGEISDRFGYQIMFYSVAVLILFFIFVFNFYENKKNNQSYGGKEYEEEKFI